jgi:hypothetical protein
LLSIKEWQPTEYKRIPDMHRVDKKLTRASRTCLSAATGLLLSFLLFPGALYVLSTYGKHAVVWAKDEPVIFTDVTGPAGVELIAPQWGAVWGDYDGDGYQDLYTGNHFNTPNLYRNNHDGTFTDMREPAGIKSGPGDWHGSAWGDYNNDGQLDLYVVTGRAIVQGSDFYVNDGDGTFTESAVPAGITNEDGRGRNTRWVDYDLDGDLDLFIANAARDIAPDVLYRNNSNGTFTDVAVQAGVANSGPSQGVAWADYDGDGHTDFLLTMVGGLSRLYRNQGNGTFVDTTQAAGFGDLWLSGATWGDYDNDSDLDLYLSLGYEDYQDNLIWNTKAITAVISVPQGGEKELIFSTTGASATFDLWQSDRKHVPNEIVYGSAKQHPEAIPFTLDNTSNPVGEPVLQAGENYSVLIWRESANGLWHIRWRREGESSGQLFGRITTAGNFTQVTPVGLDAPFEPPRPNRLFRNNGDGTFEQVLAAGVGDASNTADAEWIDFDNDGDLDLYVTNMGDTIIGNQPNRLYRNNGDGTFTDVAAAVGLASVNPGSDICSAWADYDNNGFLDFYLENSTYTGYLAGPHKLYRNSGNSNHWLQIRLIGISSNRLGIGAKIQVTTGGLTQFREVGSGSSNACGNSLLAHFGLDTYDRVDTITITWPSGKVQALHHVAADRILSISETHASENTLYIPISLK